MSLYLVTAAHTRVIAKTIEAVSQDDAVRQAATDAEPGFLLHDYLADVYVKHLTGPLTPKEQSE